MTDHLFRDDAYMKTCEAQVTGINDRGGIVLDRTVFYATGGGQPGDSGTLTIDGIGDVAIVTAVYGDDKSEIVHVPEEGSILPEVGAKVRCTIDWERRHRLMRMHTCMHLVCSVLPYPVTGGQVGPDTSRLDFDIEDAGAVDKEQLTAELNRLIEEDHPVEQRWITDEELQANPDLVRTMSVKPPTGSGRVRLLAIGDGRVDLQPCGGTHVLATGEIGPVVIQKIEKKGRLNRRVRIGFVE